MEYNKKVVLLAVAGLILTTHCQAESLPAKDFGDPDQDVVPDIPEGCPKDPVLAAPLIDPFPNTTAYASQPFRGTATGASMIATKGGKGNERAPVTGGTFCVEVALIEDAQNTITFIPLDERGCPGQTTVRTIQHKSGPGIDAGVGTIENVALQANATSDPPPDNGTPDDVRDDDTSTVAVLDFWDADIVNPGTCDDYAWIRLDLQKKFTISQINIDWGPEADTKYGVCFSVLVSASDSAGTPGPTDGDWTPVIEEEAGAAEPQNRTIDPISARSVALLLYENGGTGAWETFQVGELQVMGRDPTVAPPPSPNHCK